MQRRQHRSRHADAIVAAEQSDVDLILEPLLTVAVDGRRRVAGPAHRDGANGAVYIRVAVGRRGRGLVGCPSARTGEV